MEEGSVQDVLLIHLVGVGHTALINSPLSQSYVSAVQWPRDFMRDRGAIFSDCFRLLDRAGRNDGTGKRNQILAHIHIVNAGVLVFGPVVYLLK